MRLGDRIGWDTWAEFGGMDVGGLERAEFKRTDRNWIGWDCMGYLPLGIVGCA